MRSFNFKLVLNNVSQLKHSINKTHAYNKNIPSVLYNTVEFYHFENI